VTVDTPGTCVWAKQQCSSDADCPTGEQCVDTDFAGNICEPVGSQGQPCKSSADCQNGQKCVVEANGIQVCQ
jgi:Cys-rich repeat protein